MSEPSFETKVSLACSKELTDANGDPERIAAMVEKLAGSLAFTIAMASQGDAQMMDTLLEGVTAHIYEVAAGHAPVSKLLASIKNKTLILEIVSGVEGASIYLNNFRISGPKPWGGGKVTRSFKVSVGDIRKALDMPDLR